MGVKPALAASQRKTELIRETIKYKNSKKRCNLYVKNFDPKFNDKDLQQIFQEHGEIESIKMFPIESTEKAYAFVCFKTPDQAQNAVQFLNNRLYGQRQLQICHYELKEFRQILQRRVLLQDHPDSRTNARQHRPRPAVQQRSGRSPAERQQTPGWQQKLRQQAGW